MKITRREFLKVSGLAALGTMTHLSDLSFSAAETDADVHDIIVVGGGIAGLAAGWFLRAEDVLVLEKNTRAGGRVVMKSMGGYAVALGAEYLGPPQGAWGRLAREVGVRPVEIPAPMDAIFRNKEIYAGEDSIAHYLISNASLAVYNRFGKRMAEIAQAYDDMDEFDPDSWLGRMDRISAQDWFRQEKVPQAISEVYHVACRGLFGANLAEVSALSVIPEFGFDFEDFTPYTRKPEKRDPAPGEGSGAYSFVYGIAELTDALAAGLGDKFLIGHEVTSIQKEGNLFRLRVRRRDASEFTLRAEAVIMAIPAPLVLQTASRVLSTEQRTILAQIPYAPYLTAAMLTEDPLFNRAFDLAMPDDRFLTDLYDATWIERAYKDGARNKNAWVATAYIAGQSYRDTHMLGMSDAEIMQRLYRDLDDLAPGIKERALEYTIQRFPYAYPVMVPGAYARIARLQETSGAGELYLAGDYMAYPTFEDAADSGMEAARSYLEE